MRKNSFKILLLAMLVALTSCEDFFVDDISDANIQPVHPAEDQTIETNVTQFQWVSVDGADNYRVQILNSDNLVIQDSLVETNFLNYALEDDDYSWRVRGENSEYETAFSFLISFKVLISQDISDQEVILETPSNNSYKNEPIINYSWFKLKNAEVYKFQLLKIGDTEETLYTSDDLLDESITIASDLMDDDGQYKWRVKASNDLGETEYTERTFYLDRVNPGKPLLANPTNDQTISTGDITFTWNMQDDTGEVQSEITYTFELANDIAFLDVVGTVPDLLNQSVNYVVNETGEYYWRVQAFDKAGNKGLYSDVYSFIVE